MKALLIRLLILWLTGPAIIVIMLLTGAQILDGLFGEYSNNPLQRLGLQAGTILTLLGWIAAAIISVVTLFTKWHKYNRFMLILVVLVHIPLMILIISELA